MPGQRPYHPLCGSLARENRGKFAVSFTRELRPGTVAVSRPLREAHCRECPVVGMVHFPGTPAATAAVAGTPST